MWRATVIAMTSVCDTYPGTERGPYLKALNAADRYRPDYDPEEKPVNQGPQLSMPFLRRITKEDRQKLSKEGFSLHVSVPELKVQG